METHEDRYRKDLQRARNLIVAFFETPEGFTDALDDIRRQLAHDNVEPGRSCVLYRTRCESEGLPRLRVWSHPVPLEALQAPADQTPWFGLDGEHKRAMTVAECSEFFREKRYEVLEIRVSKKESCAAAPHRASSGNR